MEEEKLFDDDIQIDGVLLLNKTNLKKFDVKSPDINEARFLIDNYYQIQQMRINTANQIRALEQGADNKSKEEKLNDQKISTSMLLYDQYCTMESNAKNLLENFIKSNYLSRWASQVTGIGPVLAASLAAYFQLKIEEDGSTKMHAGSWWKYSGIDGKTEWLGKEKSIKIVEEIIKEYGSLTDEAMLSLCGKTGWSIDHFENFNPKGSKENIGCRKKIKGDIVWDKTSVISACSVIPYNKDLKVVCHKIGTSFHKLCNNEKSLYGRLFKERLQYELEKNERGDYKEQAMNIINTKNFNNKEMEAIYKSGKLPISHIYARCERYATKLFISHCFEAAYYNQYGTMPPKPYILMFSEGKHTDYIGPEYPYNSVPRDCEL